MVWFAVFADNLPLIIFTDPVSDVIDATSVSAADRYFRYLSTDSLNHSILYAGAV